MCNTKIKTGCYLFAFIVVATLASTVLADDPPKPNHIPVMLNWDFNCLTLSPEEIVKLVRDAKRSGAEGVNLRISNKGALNCRSKAGGPYTERLDAFGPGYDPLAILIRECRKQGIASCVWFDLFEVAYDPLILAHPELSPQGRPGQARLSGFPCYSHKEVHDHMLAIIDEFARRKPDYVFFCTKSSHIPRNHLKQPHNRDSGFNLPVVKKYQDLYGTDIRKEKFDRTKLGKIRGDFLLEYLAEAKKRLNRAGIKTIVGATVSGRLQPAGPNLRLDWRDIVRRKAADILLMANSRGEYHAFYNPRGQKLFQKIVSACHAADMKFYAYIISSGTHSKLPKKVGFAGLQDYLPRQLDYLAMMGADGILIHDLDLFTYDPGMRRSLWSTLANRSTSSKIKTASKSTGSKTNFPVPQPRLPSAKTSETSNSCHVPGDSFEAARSMEWYVQSSWKSNKNSPVANGSFEDYASGRSKPKGWKLNRAKTSAVQGIYDWKVMHDDPNSGRTFHARTSVMLQATPPSKGKPQRHAASWQAEFAPVSVPLADQVAEVQIHGEDLSGIEATGLRLTLLDDDGKTIKTYQKEGPSRGTFPWQPITIPCDFPVTTAKVRVSLFLATPSKQPGRGRVWFDQFEIRPQDNRIDLADRVKKVQKTIDGFAQGDTRPGSLTHLLARMTPGLDLVSIPFRVAEPGKYRLRTTLRSTVEQEILLVWQGKKNFQTRATIGPRGGTIELPLELKAAELSSRILVRPTKKASLELEPFVLTKVK